MQTVFVNFSHNIQRALPQPRLAAPALFVGYRPICWVTVPFYSSGTGLFVVAHPIRWVPFRSSALSTLEHETNVRQPKRETFS